MYKVGLRRECRSSRARAFVEKDSSSKSGSVSRGSGSGGKDRRTARRGNGGLKVGRGGMVGVVSAESDSNGSKFWVPGGCTGRRGGGGGSGLVKLMIW
jgi:hypothetical protein